jgi:hypothetical protein
MNVHIGNTDTNFGPRPFHLDLDKAQFRHAWLLGKSGTGKSTLLRNIIVEAVRDGCGIAVIDPHGDLIYDIFNYIPAWRKDDLIYLDPESTRAPDLGVFDNPDKEKAAQALLSLLEAHAGTGWGPRRRTSSGMPSTLSSKPTGIRTCSPLRGSSWTVLSPKACCSNARTPPLNIFTTNTSRN